MFFFFPWRGEGTRYFCVFFLRGGGVSFFFKREREVFMDLFIFLLFSE